MKQQSLKRGLWVVLGIALTGGVVWLIDRQEEIKQAEAARQAWRPWKVPSEPMELAAYKHAHALKLPQGKPIEAFNRYHQKVDVAAIPQPVPFDFCAKRLFGQCLQIKTPYQYFEHLCNTEAGEWYFKKVKDVEGVYVARRRHKADDTDQTDLFQMEDPWGGAYTEMQAETLVGSRADGPLKGFLGRGYQYVETPWSPEYWIYPSNIKEKKIGTGSYWMYEEYPELNDPTSDRKATQIEKVRAQYGVTWRGIERQYDRSNMIAGGELIVYDLLSNEVLSIRRGFALSGNIRRHKSSIYWAGANRCPEVKGNGRDLDSFSIVEHFTSRLVRNTLIIKH